MVAPTGTLVLGFGQDAADAVAPVPTAAETARAATTATRSTREIGDMLITPWVLPVREMVLLSAESAFSVSGRRVRRVNVTGRRGGPVARMVAGGKRFQKTGPAPVSTRAGTAHVGSMRSTSVGVQPTSGPRSGSFAALYSASRSTARGRCDPTATSVPVAWNTVPFQYFTRAPSGTAAGIRKKLFSA